jgi:opacity protein-like surface antigen
MKSWLIALATIAVFSAPSLSWAETSRTERPGPYFSVFLGASMPSDTTVSSYDYFFNAAFSDKVSFDPGVYTGLTAGYDFGFVRLEGELSYRYNEIKSVTDQLNGFTFNSVNGNIGAFATMFNVFLDLHNSSPVTPYLGGGLGFVNLNLSDTTGNGLLLYGNGNTTVFAYQVGGGVDIALSRNLSLDVGYRYFMTDDATFDSYSPISSSFKYESHNAALGLKFKF